MAGSPNHAFILWWRSLQYADLELDVERRPSAPRRRRAHHVDARAPCVLDGPRRRQVEIDDDLFIEAGARAELRRLAAAAAGARPTHARPGPDTIHGFDHDRNDRYCARGTGNRCSVGRDRYERGAGMLRVLLLGRASQARLTRRSQR